MKNYGSIALMREDGCDFAGLWVDDSYTKQLHEQRNKALLFMRKVGEENIYRLVADKINESLTRVGGASALDSTKELVAEAGSSLGLSEDGISQIQTHAAVSLIVSNAFAIVLSESTASLFLLGQLAEYDYIVDRSIFAERVASSQASSEWLNLLKSLRISIELLNSDEYLASDELERWQRELAKPVPSWRVGEFPLRGIGELEIESALLRTLDEDAWLRFLDGLPLPAMMEACIPFPSFDKYAEKILQWIQSSPVAFDSEGTRTPSSLVYILERRALSLMEDDLRHRCDSEVNETVGEEVLAITQEARKDLAKALRRREDGAALLAELSARSMLFSQQGSPDTFQVKLKHELYYELGREYAAALGHPKEALEYFRHRELLDSDRSRWGLWLAATTGIFGEMSEIQAARKADLMCACWAWLVELMEDGDSEISQGYRLPADWTEQLTGAVLAGLSDPLVELEQVWLILAAQRLKSTDEDPAGDWATTRFLIRTAFSAYHHIVDDQTAADVWRKGLDMALTAWLSNAGRHDAFREVSYGLGHLAKGRDVENEPARTFKYLIGQPEEASQAIIALITNGMQCDRVVEEAAGAGINAGDYLALVSRRRFKHERQKALEQCGYELVGEI